MNFLWEQELVDFRQEVRGFIQENWEDDNGLGEGGSLWATPRHREFIKKMARRGWVGIAWPQKYGGAGKPQIYQWILMEELSHAGAPHTGSGVGTVGQTLMHHGTDEQKDYFLPKIVAGDLDFALGYSEPNAGTDLASLEVRADRDGDDYVINGTKIWISAARYADYIWLATRTDQNAPKHKGISVFLVPLKRPDIQITPIAKLADIANNMVYFDNVRVPQTALVGEENRGWYYLAEALDYERIHLFPFGPVQRGMDTLLKAAKAAPAPLKGSPYWKVLRHKVAEMAIELSVLYKLTLRVLDVEQRQLVANVEASENKLFGTELQRKMAVTASEVLSLYSQLRNDPKHAGLTADVSKSYEGTLISLVAGGSNEINRSVIATRGLGLPR